MQLKFQSAVSGWLKLFVVLFNIVAAALFVARIFIDSNITLKLGAAFIAVDIIFIIPLIMLTYYKFCDDYLLIHDFPIRSFKIKYTDIVDVEDGDFETRDKSIVALSLDRVAICYNRKVKGEKTEKHYIFISPREMSLFLIRLSARLQQNKVDIEEKARELSLKQKEHELKKKLADEKRKKEKEAKAPEIIKVSGNKLGSFKTKEADTDETKE